MNKRALSAFLTLAVMLLILLPVTATNVSASEILMGDVDGNGKIDTRDASVIKCYIKGIPYYDNEITDEMIMRADATGDGIVDGYDFIYIMEYYIRSAMGDSLDIDPDAMNGIVIYGADMGTYITNREIEPYLPSVTKAGVGPFDYSAEDLPAGLEINTETGEISGVPEAAGTYTFLIHANSHSNVNDSDEFTVTVIPELVFNDSADFDVPEGTVDTAITEINVSQAVSGGTVPYVFSLESAPDWLSITEAGVVFGTRPATEQAAATATVRVTGTGRPIQSSTVTVNVGAVTPVPTPAFELTVTGGTDNTAGNPYEEGTAVSITADAPADGKRFKGWITSGGGTFENASSASTTFTMPGSPVTVTATYEDIYKHTVNGSGSEATGAGVYVSGAAVNINAGTRDGFTFGGWTTADGGSFDDESSASAVFTMPANDVTLTAEWIPVAESSAPESSAPESDTTSAETPETGDSSVRTLLLFAAASVIAVAVMTVIVRKRA